MTRQFTAIIEREDDMFVSHCPELDIASQGYSVEEVTPISAKQSNSFSKPPQVLNCKLVYIPG